MNELSLLGLRDGGEAGLWVWVAMLRAGVRAAPHASVSALARTGVVQLNREPPGPVGGAGRVNERPLAPDA